jgi:hypothetical protein
MQSKEETLPVSRWIRENGLALAAFGLFGFSLLGQIAAGYVENNNDRTERGQPPVDLVQYLGSGHFVEAVFENWESEFLQMGTFVVLTVYLRQKGSPESKPLEGKQTVDSEPDPKRPRAPWPVKRGGLALRVYENSLGLALFALFALSFALHAIGGAMAFNDEHQGDGSGEHVDPVSYVATSRFWFESFQNWQSEFLSIGALVVLSVYLRQKGSPQSKPVDHPHEETAD